MGQSQGPKIVNGVVIPPLLNLFPPISEDVREYPTYWMLERYFTGPWTPGTLDSQIEPIRVKVAATQDLTQLTPTDVDVIETINQLHNTDEDESRFNGQSFPESGLVT